MPGTGPYGTVLVQAFTEPVPAAGPFEEAVSLDKWQPQYQDWIAARRWPVAEGASVFAPLAGPFEEAVSLDKWQPTYRDHIPKRRPSPHVESPNDFSALIVPEVITLDKWAPFYIDRHLRRCRPVDEGDFDFGPLAGPWEEATSLDKWTPRYPDRIAARKPQPWIAAPEFFVTDETITLDKWVPSYPDRIDRRKAKVHGEYAVDFDPAVLITSLDRWAPTYPDLLWRRRYPQQPQGAVWNPDTPAVVVADPSAPATTADYLRALQSMLASSGYFSRVTIGEPDS